MENRGLSNAGSQYGAIDDAKASELITKATGAAIKGTTVGRTVLNQYKTAKYGELRKSAEALKGARNKQAQSLMTRETKKREAAASSELAQSKINTGFRELSAKRLKDKKAGEEEHMFTKAPVTMPSKAQQLKASGGPRRASTSMSSAQMGTQESANQAASKNRGTRRKI